MPEALTLAQELAHPFSLACALLFATWLHHLRREATSRHERAEAASALAAEQGFAALRGARRRSCGVGRCA